MHDAVGPTAATGWSPGWDAPMRRVEIPAEPSRGATALESADDRTVVAAFVSGRREAFDVIVARHQRPIYRLCYRFTGNHEDAADLAQDVFVRAFKGLRSFKGDASLATWLYRIGVNVSLNRLALKRVTTAPIESAGQVGTGVPDPLADLVDGERVERLRRAIGRLPPKQRATLILRVYHELSHAEIARVLGSSIGAVKANFFHALGNLRRLVKP